MVSRFDVCIVTLDPTVGSEIRKTRPCVVVSPNEVNRRLNTVIIAPLTTSGHAYPTRIHCQYEGKPGYVALEHIRSVDKQRIVRVAGQITADQRKAVLEGLAELFAE